MVIELDGHIHIKRDRFEQVRAEILDFNKVFVIRFTNKEITNELDTVLKKLKVVTYTRKRNLAKY